MKKLKTIFTKQDNDFRPWVVWTWNLLITREELKRQLVDIIDKGFAGIAIKPGRDMNPQFLSDEFIMLFELALKIADEHKVKIRLHTDFSVPWNTGLDSILIRNKDLRAQYLSLEHEAVVGNKKTYEWHISSPTTALVLCTRLRDNSVSPNDTRILKVSPDTNLFSWRAPAGDWKLLFFQKVFSHDPAGEFVPNVYNAKAAQTYIQTVLETFRERFSRFMPRTFVGIITEMPSLIPGGGQIPWDDDLIIKYRAKHKKELYKLIPTLFCSIDGTLYKNRSHIYNFLLQSMYERFALVIESWAKKNHLSQWTLCAEKNIYSTSNPLRSFFTIPETNLAVTGIQNLDGPDDNASVIRAMADMNSNEFKRETLTIIGRNRQGISPSLQSLVTAIDQSLLCGTSHILIDSCFFNLDRRNQIKSSLCPAWYAPDWQNMKSLCTYVSRVRGVTHGLHYSRQIAVLYPSSSALAEYLPSNDETLHKATTLFHNVVEQLQNANLEFDVVSENLLLSCSARQNGEFGTTDRVRKGNYRVLVVPFANLIPKGILVFIERLAAKRGTIIFVNEYPQGDLDSGITRDFGDRIKKLTASKRGAVKAVELSALSSALEAFSMPVAVTVNEKPCENIRISQGLGNNHECYIIHNTSSKQDFFTTLSIPYRKHLTLFDCTKGEIHAIDKVEKREGKLLASFAIAPRQTYFFVASSIAISSSKLPKAKKHPINLYGDAIREYRIVLKDQWRFRPLSLNALPLSTWNTRIGLSRESGGFSHFYESVFIARELPKHCILAVSPTLDRNQESGGNFKTMEITVNGTVRKLIDGMTTGTSDQLAADKEMQAALPEHVRNSLYCDISSLLIRGLNRVSIRTAGNLSHPLALVYPPVVMGDFSVNKDLRGWVLDAPLAECGYDSWTRHGFPYLTGRGSYTHVFEIPSAYNRLILRFTEVSGSISLSLNGKELGVFCWQPLELDVTKLCESRRNELRITVANTIDNFLRMNSRASGLVGEVYLDVY